MLKKYGIIFIIFLLFFTPYSFVGYIFMATLLGMVILSTNARPKSNAMIGILFFLGTFAYNSLTNNGYSDTKDILICIIVSAFLFLNSNNKKENYCSEWFIFTLLLLVLVSQIVMVLNIEPFATYIRDIYIDDEEMIYTGSIADMLNSSYYRASSFLGNPNQCAKFCNLLFAWYLALYEHKKLNIPICLVYISIILLAGSRTGTIVSFFLISIYVFRKIRNSKNGIRTVIFIATIYVLAMILSHITTEIFPNLRILDFRGGIEESLNAKSDVLEAYYKDVITKEDWSHYFIGNFFSSQSELFMLNNQLSLGKFDSDVGYLFYSYGTIGIILIIIFTIIKFKSNRISYYFYPIFLWVTSASVYMHFKFIIIFTIVLLCYNGSQDSTSPNKLNGQLGLDR